MYEIVKRYYDKKIYTKENVKTFVKAGKITPEQYEQITEDTYTED